MKKGNNQVPFSWEKKPGVSKDKDQQEFIVMQLPLPPCPVDQSQRVSISGNCDTNIPLPPCTFQPPLRSSSRKGLIMKKQLDDDPFLAAFKECTKSTRKPKSSRSSAFGFRFSCKNSSATAVRDDSLIQVEVGKERPTNGTLSWFM